TGLTAGAATGDQSDDVVAVGELELDERRADQLLVHLVREVHVQRPPVDAPLAGARNDPHAGDGPLATARRGSRLDGREARRGGLGGVALDGDLVGLDRGLGHVLTHGWLTGRLGHCATWPIW